MATAERSSEGGVPARDGRGRFTSTRAKEIGMQAARRQEELPVGTTRTTVRVEVPAPEPREAQVSELRRTRAVVARVGPWSVFKIALIYSFIAMLAGLGGLLILYAVLGATGVLADIERLVNAVGVGHHFHFRGAWIFSRLFTVGLILVVVVSFIAMVLAFLYNAIADLVGGIELTLVAGEGRAAQRDLRPARAAAAGNGNGHVPPGVIVWDREHLRDATGL